MSAQIRYQKYELWNSREEQVFATDFRSEITLTDNSNLILHDLLSFGLNAKFSDYRSVLGLEVDGSALELKRDYTVQTITASDESVLQILQEAENIPPVIVLQPHRLDHAQVFHELKEILANLDNNSFDDQVAELRERLANSTDENAKSLYAADEKIATIERELAAQRKADEAQLGLGQLESTSAEIARKLQDVDALIQKQRELETKVTEGADGESKFSEEKLLQAKAELMQAREQELAVLSHTPRAKISADGKGAKALQPQIGKYYWGMALALLVLGFVSYLLTKSNLSLGLAGVFVIVELSLYFFVRKLPSELHLATVDGLDEASVSTEKKQAMAGADLELREEFFVEKAWFSVHQQELGSVKESVSAKLGGSSYDQLLAEKAELLAEAEQVKTDIAAQKNQELTPERYLGKRRELDMAKVDRARWEGELRAQETGQEILDARAQLALLQANHQVAAEQSEALFKLCGYRALRVQDEKLEGKNNADWEVISQLEESGLIALYYFFQIEKWQDDKSKSLLFLDWNQQQLPRMAKKIIDGRISKNESETGQIIVINT